MFWVLDGYHDHVRKLPESEIDFSMNTEPYKKLPCNGSWQLATGTQRYLGPQFKACATSGDRKVRVNIPFATTAAAPNWICRLMFINFGT
jgi:hypothetical protein